MIVSTSRFVPRLVAGILAAVVLCWAGYLLARSNGVTGVAQSATGCSCHDPTPNANGAVTVTITGPQSVTAGTTNTYTLTVSGGPSAPNGGFDLKASAGTFTAGTNSKVSGGELTHSNDTVRSWTFTWTAPASAGTENFYAVGLAADGDGSNGGDSWNWYGGAVNTPFAITVQPQVAARAATWGRLKATYR